MYGKVCRLIGGASVALLVAACHQGESLNRVQTRSLSEARYDFNQSFEGMVDNAAMYDMALADYHFIPHSTQLSGIGGVRLNRLAALLKVYGGTVRYETYCRDDELVQARLASVREQLEIAGCDAEQGQVKAMLSGGRTTSAAEAIRIAKQGTAAGASAGAAFAAPTSSP